MLKIYNSFVSVSIFICCLPPTALLACVSICLMMSACVNTHCTDTNFLPSLSAAVGEEEPQKTIWRLAIFSSSAFRVLAITRTYFSLQRAFFEMYRENRQLIVGSLYILELIELLSLNALTLFSSSTHYPIHRNFFGLFVISSVIYMLLDYYVTAKLDPTSRNMFVSTILKRKKQIITIYFSCLSIIMLSYYVHTVYCPPYAYTVFSFFEYIAIFANVAFHYTVVLLFEDAPLIHTLSQIFNAKGQTIVHTYSPLHEANTNL